MSANEKSFVIIDDDPINNLICQKIISLTLPGAEIWTFTDPEAGLAHIQSRFQTGSCNRALLFLDINMPSLTGWEVLDLIHGNAGLAHDNVRIYMLSSSVDLNDQEKARENPLISGYLTKPLTQNKFLALTDSF